MILSLYLLAAATTLLAWVVARLRPEHRPVAWLLSVGLASDLTQRAIRLGVLAPAREAMRAHGIDPAVTPFAGAVRIAFHVSQAAFLSWIFGVAALSLWAFAGRRPRIAALGYGLTLLVLVLGYPALRGDALHRVYLGIELAALFVSLGCLIQWLRKKGRPDLEVSSTCVFVAVETAMVTIGPYGSSVFLTWDRAQAILHALYVSLILLQGAAWFRSRSSS